MKKYPAWQKAIREAQEVKAEARAEDMAHSDAEEYENVAMLLEELGLSRGKQNHSYARLGHFDFSQFFSDNDDDGTEEAEYLSISRVGLFAPGLLEDGDILLIGDLEDREERSAAQAALANILDQLDANYRFAFFRLFNKRYRRDILDYWRTAIAERLGQS